jgi:2-desacetyl-2-hydroxyethyl bacteriochlorophyllide A dehydrogenase
MGRNARAFWTLSAGSGEIRCLDLPDPGPSDVLVRTLHSAVSRGTESIVFGGRVPANQRSQMRAPFQDGEFPGPVKYGYLNVGVVDQGPAPLAGRTVFCLYPHQTAFVVPAEAVTVVPEDLPPRRAVLAGTVETAVNALWDAAPLIGDRIVVIGAGMVGCCIARLLARFPAADVTLVDVNADRATVASALEVAFAAPGDAPRDVDLVVHATGTSAGLQIALELLRPEGTVLDVSWYGDAPVSVRLGEAYHSRRLTMRSSQVGVVSPARSSSRTTADRMSLALELLRDDAFDCLLAGPTPFDELPRLMTELAADVVPGVCQTISYDGEARCSP